MSDVARSPVARLVGGRYRLEEALAGGGTADVYRATDLDSGEVVAVKELRPQFARMPSLCRRFLREAEVVSGLRHPGIARVLAHGPAGGGADPHGPYLVLELLQGETLRQLLERLGALGSLGARRIVGTLAIILEHAHQQGVIHRDLKPENVFLVGPPYPDLPTLADDPALPDRLRLADFGQARVAALASLTGVSATWGTPEYMAPEVFARSRLDPRSDLYSLGVMLFELTTGHLPWSRTSALQRLGPGAGKAGPPPSPTGAEVGLDVLIAALLAPEPQQRPESGAEVVRRLAPQGLMVTRAPVRLGCPGCGAAVDPELPVCLSCGQQRVQLRHTVGGRWRLTLRTLDDDAATVGRLLDLMAQIAEDDSRPLLFLTGDPHVYSKEERAQAIRLPAVLFRDLDEATARTLERLFREHGLDVEASSRRIGWRMNPLWFNPRTVTMSGLVTLMGSMMAARVSDSVSAAVAVVSGGWAVALGIIGAHEGDRQSSSPPLRQLRGEWLAVPAADRLLAQAGAMLGRLRSPEARGLLAELIGSLYRLALRAGRLTGSATDPAMVRESVMLADAVLQAMPTVTERAAALADRLQRLDDELAAGSEAELLQELGRVERRLDRAEAPDARRLQETRRQLEASLARRHDLETEREQLTTAMCQLLGRMRSAARQAERITQGDATQAAELAASLGEVERLLLPASAPASPSGTPDGRPSPGPAGS